MTGTAISPYQAPPPPALVDGRGRPLRAAIDTLTREVAGPTLSGVRSIWSGHPAQGLDPYRLTQILRSAESGDATAYLELAEEMEEKDGHYQSVMGTRKRAVAQLPITVEAAGDGADYEGDAALVRDWLTRLTLQSELFDILDALGKGYSVTEIVWRMSSDLWLPETLKWRLPQFFEFDQVSGEQLLLRGGIDGSGGLAEPLSPYKYITHFAPAKSGIPIRGGIARGVAWMYLFKNYTLKDWMTFLEVYGLPLRIGKYQNGTSEDDIRLLARAVAQIGTDAGAVIPASMMIEFVTQGGGAANPEMFERLCSYADDMIAKIVLGQTSSADAKSGGLGSGQADLHGEVRHDIECADAMQLAATLTRDLVVPMVMFNRGVRDRYPVIRIGRAESVDVAQALESMERGVKLGVPVAVSTFRKLTGLEEPKPGEPLLALPAPPETPQEAIDGPDGPSGAKAAAPHRLDALKSTRGGNKADGDGPVAAAAGLIAPDQPRAADAIDRMVEEALGDWEGLMDPVIAGFEDLIAAATSMAEVRELLAIRAGDAIAGMDVAGIAQLSERMGFAAKLAGLIDGPEA